MEPPFYRKGLAAFSLHLLTPQPQAVHDYIQLTVKEELGPGLLKPETRARYLAIGKELVS